MTLVKLVKNKVIEVIKKMKFDIYNRTTKQHETGIYADNPNMLRQIYGMSGEEIDILKVSDENPTNDLGNIPVKETSKEIIADDISKNIVSNNAPTPHPTLKINDSNIVAPIKIFIDNGIEYKIENNISYKKTWVDVPDINMYRMITENGKESKFGAKKLQTLDWVKIG